MDFPENSAKYRGRHSSVPKRSPEETKARFDGSPVTSITGNEIDLFGKGMSVQKIRKAMPGWAAEHGIVRNDHANDDTGWRDIIVSGNGIKESVEHGSGDGKIKAIAALPGLLKNGTYFASGPAHNGKQQGMTSHVFAAKLKQGEKTATVGFIIKEDANGKRFFNHELIKMEDPGGGPSKAGATSESEEKLPDTRQGLIHSILRKILLVK